MWHHHCWPLLPEDVHISRDGAQGLNKPVNQTLILRGQSQNRGKSFWNLDIILSVITHRPSEFYFGSKQVAWQTSAWFVPISSSPIHLSFLVPLVGCGISFSSLHSLLQTNIQANQYIRLYNLTGYVQYEKETYLWSGIPLEWTYF